MEETTGTSNEPMRNNKLNFSLDLRIISVLLLAIIVTMLFMWRPWTDTRSAGDQVIKVTGEATLRETPDEYVFSPSYQFDSDTKEAALTSLSQKSNEVVAGLKEAGVASKSIKTNSSGYENPSYPTYVTSKVSYTLQLTVTVSDSKLVQKVQDYLLSTDPSGEVSPVASFSETKRKQLESTGRNKATAEARKKADQMAENLGFKVGKVKSVSDESNNNGIFPLKTTDIAMATDSTREQIAVQPGENELTYSVSVVYYIH